ncbi:DHHW family protein [Hydrogenoanaerobacterium sp.]|uniref:DHHW family protein n=1 Tax=Hydrogenoanaerobacterium sp. TaxID=2953763 RepID=UPI00289FE3EE|nr:DHHW family protein [Hydrogenoanaerobacterium sp.]
MMGKRVSALIFLLLMLLVPAWTWISGGFDAFPVFDILQVASGDYAKEAEKSFRQVFPQREQLSNFAWNLRYRTGAKEIDGYFITDTSIIKNVAKPNRKLVEANNAAIMQFAQRVKTKTYFMLLPTASAVKQQSLPDFATPYNQKSFIDDIYQSFGGELLTVDVYPMLFANQSKNLYYNTEDQITPLGGYYTYMVLGDKLGTNVNSLDKYTIEYVKHDYEGSLKTKFPYAQVKNDVITLYHYRLDKFYRTYTIRRTEDNEYASLNDLYDRSCLLGEKPLDVYFGGMSQIVDITIKTGADKPSPNKTKLLIIGDETAKSYVPFLTPHYSEIQIINAATATPQQLSDADILYYDQVLFAFSTDTYMHCENLSVLGEL